MRTMTLVAAAAVLASCGDGAGANRPQPGAPAGTATGAPAPTAPQQATPAARPEMRAFRDWRAACDNGNACVAWTGSNEGGWIRIGMEAGPAAQPTVVVSEGFDGADGPSAARLKVDGRVLPLRGGPSDAANAEASGRRARTAVTALAAARSASVDLDDRSIAMPVAGVSAALLWIDERQGRLGTTTALLRGGDRSAAAVPAAPALPRVVPAPPIAQGAFGAASPMVDDPPPGLSVPAAIEARPEVKDCRSENNEYLNKAILAVRLDASTVLWGVPCGSGAYNATFVLYLADPDGRNVRPADLPMREPRPAGAEGDLWLVNPVYDTRAQTLTVFPRGRGLGDCGTIQTWTWTRAGFALTEERLMGDCQGMSPEHWPTMWRTRD